MLVFFLMIRRPPRSTLFPYTTLVPISRLGPRAPAVPPGDSCRASSPCPPPLVSPPLPSRNRSPRSPSARSEEHTSELQSRGHLVCRLLLEKKKKTQRQPRRLSIHNEND